MRSHMQKLTAAALVALAACGSPEERAAREQEAARGAMAAAEATGRQAAVLPATGLWSEAHVMDRLVRAGVAPRAHDGAVPDAPWMGRAPIALRAGGGEVFVWIYADSAARRAVTDALDADTGAPRGTVSPFAPPLVFVMQNNLAAVITGGSERNIERIMLAFQAGLPAAQ